MVFVFITGLSICMPNGNLAVISASDVLSEIYSNPSVEYDKVTIVGNLNLSECIPSNDLAYDENRKNYANQKWVVASSIRITNSTINGTVDFDNTLFEKPVSFDYTKFIGYVGFNNSTFNSTTGFLGSEFNHPSYFIRTEFYGDAYFQNSKFNSYAVFEDTRFKGNTTFRNSYFNSTAYFRKSGFNHSADFISNKFDGDVHFQDSTFNGKAVFWKSGFNNSANFKGIKFNDNVTFQDSAFGGEADFQGSTFNISDFTEVQFNKDAKFDDAKFAGRANFNSARFMGDALFENTIFNSSLSLTKTRYDKLFIRWHNINGLVYSDSAYMSLIKNFKDLGYFEDHDTCYYDYRVNHRSYPWNIPGETFLKFIDFLSECSYGYGVRPMNPLLSSIAIIIFFGIFWSLNGMARTEECSKRYDPAGDSSKAEDGWRHSQTIIDALSPFTFSFTLFISTGKFLVDPPDLPKKMKRPKSWTKRMYDLERFLGGVFLALFFLALNSTMIRAL